MANTCYFQIKIKSESKQNLERFINILYSVDKEYSLAGIYGAEWVDVGEDSDELNIYQEPNGNYATVYQGDCKWSVKYSMRESNLPEDRTTLRGLSLTSIEELSKQLDLTVEVYSEELGYEFAEHCIIEQGNVALDEEIYFTEIIREEESWEDWLSINKNQIDHILQNSDYTLTEIKDIFNKSITENLNYVTVGGYGYFDFTI